MKPVLCTLGVLASLGIGGCGVLSIMAGAMSDDPYAGDAAGKQGLIMVGVGVGGLAVSVVAAIWL